MARRGTRKALFTKGQQKLQKLKKVFCTTSFFDLHKDATHKTLWETQLCWRPRRRQTRAMREAASKVHGGLTYGSVEHLALLIRAVRCVVDVAVRARPEVVCKKKRLALKVKLHYQSRCQVIK